MGAVDQRRSRASCHGPAGELEVAQLPGRPSKDRVWGQMWRKHPLVCCTLQPHCITTYMYKYGYKHMHTSPQRATDTAPGLN